MSATSGWTRLAIVVLAIVELGWLIAIGGAYADLQRATEHLASLPTPPAEPRRDNINDLLSGQVDIQRIIRDNSDSNERYYYALAVSDRDRAATDVKALVACLIGTPLLVLLTYFVLRWILLGFRPQGA